MSNKLYLSLSKLMLVFIISIIALGGLTFSMYNQWRKSSLLEEEYKIAKDQIRDSQTLMDQLFKGEIKHLAPLYTPLSQDKMSDYEAAKKKAIMGDDANLDALFAAHLPPPKYLGWGCFLAIIVFAYLSFRVYKPIFQTYSSKMALTCLLVGLLGGYFAYLAINNIYPMGIDLAGGTELIYRLDYESSARRIKEAQDRLESLTVKMGKGEKDNDKPITDDIIRDLRKTIADMEESRRTAPEKATDVVRKRVDPNGTRGIPITQYGEGRLRIQLPKASQEDVDRIKRAIMRQGRLTFHICADERTERDVIDKIRKDPNKENDVYKEMIITTKNKYDPKKVKTEAVYIRKIPELEGSRVVMAGFRPNVQDGGYEVNLRFDGAGATRFEEVTSLNINKRLAIVLDNVCHVAPNIKTRISSDCQITGSFTKEEAESIAAVLTAGSLPAEVKEDSEFSVGPALGHEQIRSGVVATLIGGAAVALFMWGFYRAGGFVTVICLAVLLTVLMGALGFFKATLTLPGIAGIMLNLGMAVDANVLIFERMREELARGRVLRLAVQHGFDRAAVTILDSQLTTLLSGVILYYLGTGPIRGFAVTLNLGILVTLFANLWVCRNIIEWLVSIDALTSFKPMQILTNAKIDFMGIRRPYMLTSAALVLASVGIFTYMGIFNSRIYDLDFTGGTLLQFNFAKGQEQTKDAVGDVVAKNLRPLFKEQLEKAVAHLNAVASLKTKDGKDADEIEMRKELYAKLPLLGRSQFGSASTVDKASLESMAKDIQNVLNEFELIELKAEPFSSPIAGTGPEKYRSFTLTTRMTQSASVVLLNDELLREFAGKLVPPAIEAKEKKLRIRFDLETAATDQELKDEVDRALLKVTNAKQNEPLKPRLAALKTESAKKEPYGDGERAYLEITGLTDDATMNRKIQDAIEEAKIKDLAEGPISRKSSFGSQVAGEMRLTAIFAAVGALAGIFLYLWFRFQFSCSWGFGAILALFHDAFISIGAVCLFNVTGILPILIDLNLVAAIMTIIGYSVNDTIVVFDRIREIRTQHPTRDLAEVINEAVNATLSRTLLTSGTTLLATLALFLFGGETIRGLSFTLTVGILVGTYSSIFMASPAMLWWINKFGAGKAPVPGLGKPKGEVAPSGAQI